MATFIFPNVLIILSQTHEQLNLRHNDKNQMQVNCLIVLPDICLCIVFARCVEKASPVFTTSSKHKQHTTHWRTPPFDHDVDVTILLWSCELLTWWTLTPMLLRDKNPQLLCTVDKIFNGNYMIVKFFFYVLSFLFVCLGFFFYSRRSYFFIQYLLGFCNVQWGRKNSWVSRS